ncbi:hypothetical protein Poly30_29700 [Planctomycetes bacterium Poly30]|uniref:Cytochrome c domain-containing protein n=1 Tax=Saltatorellus ferox TaxID=2528018 RepID=A0A518ETP5_9BACT|nr:hypothetical protein Poly30_29700 [Planctomycetes bacterium Poly30]
MKPPVIIAGILLLLLSVIGGVVAMMSQGGGAAAYDSMSGQEIYAKLCQQCHGERGTAPRGLANSYARKREFWNEENLLAYIASPISVKKKMPHLRDSKRVMPAISKSISVAARRKLVAHVLGLMDALEPKTGGPSTRSAQ